MVSLSPEASQCMKEPRLHPRPQARVELQGVYMGMKETGDSVNRLKEEQNVVSAQKHTDFIMAELGVGTDDLIISLVFFLNSNSEGGQILPPLNGLLWHIVIRGKTLSKRR